MITTLPPVISARWFPVLAAIEADLQTRFLGTDLDEACAAAAAVKDDPRFLATAALPLKNRQETFTRWHSKQVLSQLSMNVEFRTYFDAATPDVQESIRAGEVSFATLDGQISAFQHERIQRRSARLLASKEALNLAIRSALRDSVGNEEGRITPGFLVILASGEVGIFRRRAAGLKWARESGVRFMAADVAQASLGIHAGPEAD